MTRRFWSRLLWFAALGPGLGVACDDESGPTRPRVTVFRIDQVQGNCYVACGDAVADSRELTVLEERKPCPASSSDCVFRQGVDQLLVVADYTVGSESCEAVEPPTVTATPEGQADTGAQTVVQRCGVADRHLAMRPLDPFKLSNASRFSLRVDGGHEYSTTLPSLQLQTPQDITIEIEGCPPSGDCHLNLGRDTAKVIARGYTSLDAPTLYWSVKGQATQSKVMPAWRAVSGVRASTEEIIELPSAPGNVLSVYAQIGPLRTGTVSATLDRPEELVITLSRSTQPDKSAVVAGDPAAICRKLDVTIKAPTGLPGKIAPVVVNQGSLASGSAKQDVPLNIDGNGFRAITQLDLPIKPTERQVTVTVAAGTPEARTVAFELLPMLTGTAKLSGTHTLQVSATGSESATLTGTAQRPAGAPDAIFPPGTRLFVVATATADGSQPPCGPPSPPEELNCNRTNPAAALGGCLLAPSQVEIAADGTFSLPLHSGVCFAGQITLDLYGTTYTSDEFCLADRTTTPSSSPRAQPSSSR